MKNASKGRDLILPVLPVADGRDKHVLFSDLSLNPTSTMRMCLHSGWDGGGFGAQQMIVIAWRRAGEKPESHGGYIASLALDTRYLSF